jgi:hypothetical protein
MYRPIKYSLSSQLAPVAGLVGGKAMPNLPSKYREAAAIRLMPSNAAVMPFFAANSSGSNIGRTGIDEFHDSGGLFAAIAGAFIIPRLGPKSFVRRHSPEWGNEAGGAKDRCAGILM